MPFVLCSLAANVSPRKPIFSMETNFQNSKNSKYAVCIVLPSNKCDTMETNFQNTKN